MMSEEEAAAYYAAHSEEGLNPHAPAWARRGSLGLSQYEKTTHQRLTKEHIARSEMEKRKLRLARYGTRAKVVNLRKATRFHNETVWVRGYDITKDKFHVVLETIPSNYTKAESEMLVRYQHLQILESRYAQGDFLHVKDMLKMWQYNGKLCQVVKQADVEADGE